MLRLWRFRPTKGTPVGAHTDWCQCHSRGLVFPEYFTSLIYERHCRIILEPAKHVYIICTMLYVVHMLYKCFVCWETRWSIFCGGSAHLCILATVCLSDQCSLLCVLICRSLQANTMNFQLEVVMKKNRWPTTLQKMADSPFIRWPTNSTGWPTPLPLQDGRPHLQDGRPLFTRWPTPCTRWLTAPPPCTRWPTPFRRRPITL